MDIIFKDRKGKNNTNRKNVNTILPKLVKFLY